MNVRESISVAFSSLVANKMRSALTMLGIIIGVGAVITMIALGQGAEKAVTERIKSLGTNLLFVHPGSARSGRVRLGAGSRRSLKRKDVDAILRHCQLILAAAPEFTGIAQVKYRNQNWNTRVIGTTPEYQWIRNFPVAEGRFFTPREDQARARVCLIGSTVKENLFGEEDPIGKTIRINRMNFQVIGLLETKGQTGFFDQDDLVLIPLGTAQMRLFGVDFITGASLQVIDQTKMDEAFYEVERILRHQHRLRADQDNDFIIRNQADILSTFEETSKTFTYLLAGIAAVSLLVGGIGIMNIMLVSVTERTREIGIRKAVGAKRRDILLQFLIESLVLALSGGAIGILLGVVGSIGLTHLAQWRVSISIEAILVSFLFAAGVGVIFGLYPARRAAYQDVIVALRYE